MKKFKIQNLDTISRDCAETRNSCPYVFNIINVMEKFLKFREKKVRWSSIFGKVAGLRP